uniref:PiggyBac transposable element-derived protein domain-containing protein n=1 Tax=Graphocephala atropunctata TaxID=36148 RepID=A0A1B6LW93_9HEMI
MSAIPGPSGLQTSRVLCETVPTTYSDEDSDNWEDDDDEVIEPESEIEDLDYEANPPQWSSFNRIGMKPVQFTKEEGFLVPLPEEKSPISFFRLLVDIIFLEGIVKATNNYALELFCGPSTVPGSRISKWKDLSVDELWIFIGLLLHMGIIQMPRLQDYWKQSKLFISVFPKYMSRDRFLAILRCLNFENHPDKNNRSSKVQFLIDYFNNKMTNIYYPQQNLCIDEGMVLWRGRLYFRQYIKGKRHKYGIKLYSLCDPHGLILKFFMYCGVMDDYGGKGHAANVVLNLMQGKLNCGHSLYMDNFYNSFSLASQLLRRNTYCTGTLRLDRKYISKQVKSAKLKKGETIGKYAESVMVGKWRDKRIVSYISTEHKNKMVTSINRNGVEREKPLPIVKYNHFMKGVDRSDQMMSYYPCERKTLRWYKKISNVTDKLTLLVQ